MYIYVVRTDSGGYIDSPLGVERLRDIRSKQYEIKEVNIQSESGQQLQATFFRTKS